MGKQALRIAYHTVVYTIGVVVLLAAVSVTTIRLLLPDIGIYRTEVEAWVSNYMGLPIAIRSLDATWYGWIPYLELRNIDLLNRAGTEVITHFESAKVAINPIATLRARRFVPKQLTVSGFNISVVRLPSGAINIAGVSIDHPGAVASNQGELAEWLFSQERIRIEKGTVEWIDALHEQEPILLQDVTLELRSGSGRLQVNGSTTLPAMYGKQMDFAFDSRGNLLTADWAGELYLHASDVNPDNWYRKFRPLNINIAGGSADISVWSSWKDARLAGVQGSINYRDFATLIGEASLRVEELQYRFLGQRKSNEGWQIAMSLNNLVTENGVWPDTNLSISTRPSTADGGGDRYRIAFEYLKLDDLLPLVSRLDAVPDKTRDLLKQLSISGELSDGYVELETSPDAPTGVYFDTRFANLTTSADATRPGLDGASGRARGSLTGGELVFDNDTARVSLPALNIDALQFDGIRGSVSWSHEGGSWRVGTGQLTLHTPDFSARLSGEVRGSDAGDEAPYVDIVAAVEGGELDKISPYLPRSDHFRLRDWLHRAVVGGSLISADAAFRGRIDQYPFPNQEGRFTALVNMENVALDYSDKWPPIELGGAEVRLVNDTMSARLTGGRIFNARISDTDASIPDLRAHHKRLQLDGKVSGAVSDLNLFVENSPLGKDALLSRVNGALHGGEVELDLDLNLPVGPPGEGDPAVIRGTMSLSDTTVKSGFHDMDLDGLSGDIEFTRTSADGTGLEARFRDQSVTVDIAGAKGESSTPPRVTIHGVADRQFIMDELVQYVPWMEQRRETLASRLRGATDWDLDISYLRGAGDSSIRRRVELSSALGGLMVDAPAPVGKGADEAVRLSIARDLDLPEPAPIEIRYGPRIAAVISPADPVRNRDTAIGIRLGERTDVPLPDHGIRVSGPLQDLSLSDWLPLFAVDPGKENESGNAFGAVSLDLDVGTLQTLGQHYAGVKIAATRDNGKWDVHLDGAGVSGQIGIPVPLLRRSIITAELQRLRLERAKPEPGSKPFDPRTLPSLSIYVGDLEFDGKNLGAAGIHAMPVPHGIDIDRFEFTKPELEFHGSGSWVRSDKSESSSFRIQLHAAQIDQMLETFGYNVAAISKGETQLDIDAGWDGTPMDFSWARLNGSLNMQILKGQLLDVEPKAGRLFGLLSIQTLPRRLSLDFTDLFGKGLAFDVIEGNFEISNGNAYTNDLHMRGPSANVSVAGRTGLAEQDYDQVVTVTPQIADTLPVASALFGPFGMGVGAVVYLVGEMFDSLHEGIDRLLRYQYTITGSWDQPVIEKYEAANG